MNMLVKGKLIVTTKGNRLSESERRSRALDDAKNKLREAKLNRVHTLFQNLNVTVKVELYQTVFAWVYSSFK